MAWGIVYYKTKSGEVPGEQFLDRLASEPGNVDAKIESVLQAVRDAPPPAFSGGGYWEAMHDDMGGYHEVRVKGPGKKNHRLFCVLDNGDAAHLEACGLDKPVIAVINGMTKGPREGFSDSDYKRFVRNLGEDYLRTFPRRIAR